MKLSARTSDHVAVSDREESQSLFDNAEFQRYERRVLNFIKYKAGKRGLCTRDVKRRWPDPRHERWLLTALSQLTSGDVEAYQCGSVTRYRVKENRPVMYVVDEGKANEWRRYRTLAARSIPDSFALYGKERGLM